jgi:hypothetical protein
MTMEVLEKVHQGLKGSHIVLQTLRNAVIDLPRFWQRLVDLDPDLDQVPGAKYLGDLALWAEQGGPLPQEAEGEMPYHCQLAVTVLCQISQYMNYLAYLGTIHRDRNQTRDAHQHVLDSVTRSGGGIQGLCVGFLSALAIAVSACEDEIGPSAAVALRLAVCVGAYVDRDTGPFSSDPRSKMACVAVRWKAGIVDEMVVLNSILDGFAGVSKRPLIWGLPYLILLLNN